MHQDEAIGVLERVADDLVTTVVDEADKAVCDTTQMPNVRHTEYHEKGVDEEAEMRLRETCDNLKLQKILSCHDINAFLRDLEACSVMMPTHSSDTISMCLGKLIASSEALSERLETLSGVRTTIEDLVFKVEECTENICKHREDGDMLSEKEETSQQLAVSLQLIRHLRQEVQLLSNSQAEKEENLAESIALLASKLTKQQTETDTISLKRAALACDRSQYLDQTEAALDDASTRRGETTKRLSILTEMQTKSRRLIKELLKRVRSEVAVMTERKRNMKTELAKRKGIDQWTADVKRRKTDWLECSVRIDAELATSVNRSQTACGCLQVCSELVTNGTKQLILKEGLREKLLASSKQLKTNTMQFYEQLDRYYHRVAQAEDPVEVENVRRMLSEVRDDVDSSSVEKCNIRSEARRNELEQGRLELAVTPDDLLHHERNSVMRMKQMLSNGAAYKKYYTTVPPKRLPHPSTKAVLPILPCDYRPLLDDPPDVEPSDPDKKEFKKSTLGSLRKSYGSADGEHLGFMNVDLSSFTQPEMEAHYTVSSYPTDVAAARHPRTRGDRVTPVPLASLFTLPEKELTLNRRQRVVGKKPMETTTLSWVGRMREETGTLLRNKVEVVDERKERKKEEEVEEEENQVKDPPPQLWDGELLVTIEEAVDTTVTQRRFRVMQEHSALINTTSRYCIGHVLSKVNEAVAENLDQLHMTLPMRFYFPELQSLLQTTYQIGCNIQTWQDKFLELDLRISA